jgi:hypothetical protein
MVTRHRRKLKMATAKPVPRPLPNSRNVAKEKSPPVWMTMFEAVFAFGWVPPGYRTQLMALVVMVATIVATLVDWAGGDLTFSNLLVAAESHWGYYAGALGLTLIADKVDRS